MACLVRLAEQGLRLGWQSRYPTSRAWWRPWILVRGQFTVPDSIDAANPLIAELFEQS